MNTTPMTFLKNFFSSKRSSSHLLEAGSLGTDSEGILPPDAETQANNAILNLEKILRFSGLSLGRIQNLRVSVHNGRDILLINRVLSLHFVGNPPCTFVVEQIQNDAVKVELRCRATKKAREARL